jgi:glucose-fructose oxidoreductase
MCHRDDDDAARARCPRARSRPSRGTARAGALVAAGTRDAPRPDMTPIRFAVVGLGHFAQAAVLPAIHRQRGVELTALVSGTDDKLDALGKRYKVARLCGYEEYDALLASGAVDAVYVTVPNDLHCDAVVRAARRGVHVLCEKPMAPTEDECRLMIEACEQGGARLMIGYRLHFQAANLYAVEQIGKGVIGEPRVFSSVFTFQIREGNTRTQPRAGAGPLFDIGIYCINAARYVFQGEPITVQADRIHGGDDPRFASIDEGYAVTMEFEHNRIANFVCSYGAADRSHYEVIGTDGVIEVDRAYEYTQPMTVTIDKQGKQRRRQFRKTDQIAAEVQYFAKCIREQLDPEPGGVEGLIDVTIIGAIERAARTGQRTYLPALGAGDVPPSPDQVITRPAHDEPAMVGGVQSASKD